MKASTILLAALLATLAPVHVNARTINWGSSVGDSLFDSTGAPLDDTYTFELGTFGTFVPDSTNIDQWEANWHAFDRATAPGTFSSADGYFSSSATLLSDGTSSASPPLTSYTFSFGEQAYIWAFNTQTLAVNTTEWALLTNSSVDGNSADDWTVPSPADHSILPLQWRLPLVTDVIFGGANDLQGPGNHTPPSTSFQLQTHTVSTVPEPGSVFLVLVAGMAMRVRLRRRA